MYTLNERLERTYTLAAKMAQDGDKKNVVILGNGLTIQYDLKRNGMTYREYQGAAKDGSDDDVYELQGYKWVCVSRE